MRDGHHKEAAEVAKANREPKATPFPPAEAWSLPVLCASFVLCNTLLWLRLVSFLAPTNLSSARKSGIWANRLPEIEPNASGVSPAGVFTPDCKLNETY